MTSSLVGSEMCIRDRSGRTRQARPENSGDRTLSPEIVAAPVPLAPAGACLLYTSDAADDM
eukprot:8594600-Prorocentrum_lima.AAC.1